MLRRLGNVSCRRPGVPQNACGVCDTIPCAFAGAGGRGSRCGHSGSVTIPLRARLPSSLRALLTATVALDRRQIAVGTAARCSIGVGVPLLIGTAVDQVGHGVAAAAGALVVGFATFQGVYRTRAQVVLLTCLGVALSTFVGALAGHALWSAIAVVAVWGFASGLLAVLGQQASVVGLLSVMALLLVAEFPATPAQAALRAGLVLAGGLFQAMLVVALWPLRGFRAERRVLATAYRSVAGYAAAIPDGGLDLPDADTVPAARATLADPQPFSRSGETLVYRGMLDVAERSRTELAALARTRQRLDTIGATDAVAALDDLVVTVAATLAVVAAGLDASSTGLNAAQPAPELATARTRARGAVARLAALAERESPGQPGAAVLGEAVQGAQALLGQLRALIRLALEPSGVDESTSAPVTGPRWRIGGVRDVLSTLRANLTLRSAACRHAVRLAIALAIGTAIYRLVPLDRGYWLPLTTLVVLRPDFSATFTRGLSRVGGTLLGAGLATAITVLLHPGPVLLTVLVVVLAWSTYAFFQANYAAFSLCVTALVVFLLAFVGLPEDDAVVYRLVDTLIGGGLALVIFAAWPTWERRFVSERLAELLERQSEYGTAILNAYAVGDPSVGGSPAERRAAFDAARLARSDAEASVDRWLEEPARSGRLEPVTAVGVLAAVQRYAHAVLALDARLPDHRGAAPAATELASQLDDALQRLAGIIRGEPATPLPPLRDAQLALAAATDGVAPGRDHISAALLVAETDRMVDAVDTIGYLLSVDRP